VEYIALVCVHEMLRSASETETFLETIQVSFKATMTMNSSIHALSFYRAAWNADAV